MNTQIEHNELELRHHLQALQKIPGQNRRVLILQVTPSESTLLQNGPGLEQPLKEILSGIETKIFFCSNGSIYLFPRAITVAESESLRQAFSTILGRELSKDACKLYDLTHSIPTLI